jgi:nucleotide-binding universal stress UspA family protein
MKRILVAIDGSDGADRAVDYAARLAASEGADLLIVNVVGGYGLPESVLGSFSHTQQVWLDELLIAASAEMLTKARDRARKLGTKMIQLESRPGDVVETVIAVAQEKKVDMIVVGKRGAGRITGLLLGSVSQKLVSLAPVPVAVIP